MSRGRAGLAGVLVLAAALRLYALGDRSFWNDEAATMLILRADFGDILDRISRDEASPPLYYVLGWLWAQAVGTGEAATRLLPAAFGVALVAVVHAIAKRAAGERAAFAAALLTAVSPLTIWYAQDARTYSLYLLLTALTVLATQKVIEDPTTRRLGAWAGAATLALCAHYFTGFLLVAEVGAMLVAGRPEGARWLGGRPPGARRVLLAAAVPLAAALALLPLAAAQQGHAALFLEETTLFRRLAAVPVEMALGPQGPLLIVLAPLGCLLLAAAAWPALRRPTPAVVLLAVLVVVPIVAVLLIEVLAKNTLATRNVIEVWTPVAALLGVGIAAARRTGPVILGALTVLGIGVTLATADEPKYDQTDWRAALGAIGPRDPDRAVFVQRGGRRLMLFYRDAYYAGPGHRVTELVAIGGTHRVARFGTESDPVGPPAPPAPPGFELVEERYEDSYALARYRSTTPRPVPDMNAYDANRTYSLIDGG